MRRALLLALLALAATPPSAAADGLPVGNVDVGEEGVSVPGAPDRIVALRAGAGSTVVARVERDGGGVQRSLWVREPLTVPGVALDGTADGRSSDGRTAVLIRPRAVNDFPLRRTRLVILGVRPLKVRRRVTLRGDFSFDALSPDGRRMFLVQYVDPRDPRAYVVRTFDVRRGRLEPGAIVDARDPDEDMRGYPVTRVTSGDGRWAYTLYDGVGEPFVHALDTVGRRAFCIDLPMLDRHPNPSTLRLRLDRRGLGVVEAGVTAARVDTRTMTAAAPAVGWWLDDALAARAATEPSGAA
ncbi:MAG TPA: hypothetical protein VHF89_08990 [Solirubrobacteraceae bacterium]|nr:hypothetical protein [Solirubrobacteraceae bacterium]